jgi:hypothetical protein
MVDGAVEKGKLAQLDTTLYLHVALCTPRPASAPITPMYLRDATRNRDYTDIALRILEGHTHALHRRRVAGKKKVV